MATKQQFQPPSNHFLKTLGYRFSRILLNYDNMYSENYLWRAVVVNALEDTMIRRDDRKSSTLKTNAHNWVLGNSFGYDRICHWAMLDPEQVSNAYKEALKKGNIIFTNKHLHWHLYNTLSKKHKNCLDIRIKNNIKKEMRFLRQKVVSEKGELIENVCSVL
tara:strand:+ start:1469 stop:1954 length:486 start_codon:yes stop_codon:yes gene_type:complete